MAGALEVPGPHVRQIPGSGHRGARRSDRRHRQGERGHQGEQGPQRSGHRIPLGGGGGQAHPRPPAGGCATSTQE
ncbi:hypothetical protein UO65_4489 [Actinokineospora spheciospongiae]|uniref:Uncharacterized protein n=1 Tax=Actinokineospora spheciospongiae TaxID=909613 RepID=W7IJ17_9PSEU|nr:hypothetical protein UO65_4489 [Actinokineospora spheciospongiae]